MFRQNDKITLTLMNARDIQGNILPFELKLPLTNEYSIPENIVALDVFEYHEGLVNGGNVAFSIYMGETTSINNLIKENIVFDIKITKNIVNLSMDTSICVQNISGKKVVFSIVNEQDVVVKDKEKLIQVIEQLSSNFKVMNDSIEKIHILIKKK